MYNFIIYYLYITKTCKPLLNIKFLIIYVKYPVKKSNKYSPLFYN